MRMLSKVSVILIVLSSLSFAQSKFDDVKITPLKVTENVYMLEGYGGNIGVSIGEDGILMIDDQFAELAEKIEAVLTSLSSGELRFVLNTHVHGDHVGGNSHFSNKATIIAHANLRQRMIDKFNDPQEAHNAQGKEGWPVITFDSSLTIHFNDNDIAVFHLPKGHTDGDAVIHFPKENVFHVSDLFFNGLFPYIDLDNGGTVSGYIKNVTYLLSVIPDDARIIPGHGPLADKAAYTEFLKMLIETTSTIQTDIKMGMSLEELQAKGVAKQWQGYSWGFIPTERWIETIYNDYKMTKK